MAATVLDLGINRNALTGLHHQQIAGLDLSQRHQLITLGCAQSCGIGPERGKGPDRLEGLALGPAFQIFAQQYKADNHCRGFVIEHGHHAWIGTDQMPGTQGPAGSGAHDHQHIHVAGPIAQGMPGTAVEACAKVELHDRGQQ